MVTPNTIVNKMVSDVPPEPEYPYCNKGHRLQPVWVERYQKYMWDCPTCMRR